MFGPDDAVTLNPAWLGAAALAVAGTWALFRFASSMRRDRVLADTPLVKIRSAAQGYVKVAGRAKASADGPLAAPLSARPCVWWSYELDEKITNSKGESHWSTVESATSVAPFVLADADAECLVGPVNAEISPTRRDRWYGDRPHPGCLPEHRRGLLGDDTYRYDERLLCVGDSLSVAGELRSTSVIDTAQSAAQTLLRTWKQNQTALLARFDRNHDGRIDADEWDAARRVAVAESESGLLGAGIDRISVIGQSTQGEPFLIAPLNTVLLVRRERMRALAYLGLGLLCMASSAALVQSTVGRADTQVWNSGSSKR